MTVYSQYKQANLAKSKAYNYLGEIESKSKGMLTKGSSIIREILCNEAVRCSPRAGGQIPKGKPILRSRPMIFSALQKIVIDALSGVWYSNRKTSTLAAYAQLVNGD